ncbi:hypothetical protein POUND7_020464 [Theobroma cacao]
MSDVVETLEPLQCTGGSAGEVSSSLNPKLTGGAGPFAMGGVPDYRMRHRFSNNVGPVSVDYAIQVKFVSLEFPVGKLFSA